MEFCKNIICAFWGRKQIQKLKKIYGYIKDWKIIVQGTQDEEYLCLGNKYIAEIVADKSKNILLIYDKKKMPMYKGNDIELCRLSKRQIKNIVVFYSMQKFAKDFVIYGDELINTNKIYNLQKHGVMNKSDVAKIQIGIGS